MARAPFQVLVFPYRLNAQNQNEFALLKRVDAGFWQGVAGGGEGAETPLDAARRETFEEIGIDVDEFLRLDTVEYVPVTELKESLFWGENVFVIPQYCYGVRTLDREIRISHEHSEFGWFLFDEAYRLLKFDGNKTALWELHQRLKGKGPRG